MFNRRHIKTQDHQKGFTLVETVVAILILSLSLGALLTLAAGGFFTVRYARNQMVADNLAQEAFEYIRNERDNAINAGTTWAAWLETMSVDQNGQPMGGTADGCYDNEGCIVDPYTTAFPFKECGGTCDTIDFFANTGLGAGFYGYDGGNYPFSGSIATTYVRTVTLELVSSEELRVTVTMEWLNGTLQRTMSQSMLLTNWNLPL